ncbi:MAG: hypothetical protein R3F30_10660 [Planctomycetota bacterium]
MSATAATLLARVLCRYLLLLDELASSLDPGHRLAISPRRHGALARERDQGVLWVTHDLNLAAQFRRPGD